MFDFQRFRRRMSNPRFGMLNDWHNQARIPRVTCYYKNTMRILNVFIVLLIITQPSAYGPHQSKGLSVFRNVTSNLSVCDYGFWLLFITSDLREIWNIVDQWADRLLPTSLDRCLQPAVMSEIDHLNMKLPEDGSGIRRNVLKNVMWRVMYRRVIKYWFRRRLLKWTKCKVYTILI